MRRLPKEIPYRQRLGEVCITGFARTLLQSANAEIRCFALVLQNREQQLFLIWVAAVDVALLFSKIRLEADDSKN
jgi:hypothetical protein